MGALSRRLLIVSLAGLLQSGAVEAQDDAAAEPKSDPRRQEVYRTEAAGYELAVSEPERQALEFRPEPVMRWVSLNDYDGNVFVWTRRGRPEAVGSVFSFPAQGAGQRNVMHEFHSLSDRPIEVSGPGGRLITLTPPIELEAIAGAPAAAEGAAGRRIQARAIAREFSARMRKGEEDWELRLLSQPLYSYGEGEDGVLGGAVFAFVGYVTDPEILLLVEARETKNGPRWFFAPARFSNKSLWLRRGEDEVWSYLADDPSPVEVPYHLSPVKTVTIPAAD